MLPTTCHLSPANCHRHLSPTTCSCHLPLLTCHCSPAIVHLPPLSCHLPHTTCFYHLPWWWKLSWVQLSHNSSGDVPRSANFLCSLKWSEWINCAKRVDWLKRIEYILYIRCVKYVNCARRVMCVKVWPYPLKRLPTENILTFKIFPPTIIPSSSHSLTRKHFTVKTIYLYIYSSVSIHKFLSLIYECSHMQTFTPWDFFSPHQCNLI